MSGVLDRLRSGDVGEDPSSARRSAAVAGAVGIVAFLLLWEVVVRLGLVSGQYFPPASTVLRHAYDLLSDRATWDAIAATMSGWAWGLAIGVPVAVVVGLVIGSIPLLSDAVRPIIEFLRPVPSVALVPLGVLLFGVELEVKVFLVVYAVFFPMLYQTIYGVQSVDRVARESAVVYGVGPLRRTLLVVLPSAAPYIVTGIRISSSIALVLCVTAELVIGVPGLGERIGSEQMIGEYPDMYVYLFLAGVLGIVLNAIFRAIGRRVVWWQDKRQVVGAA